MSFVIVPSGYPKIPILLKLGSPDFADSKEYQSLGNIDDLPGVAAAAFAKFLVRTVSEKVPVAALTHYVSLLGEIASFNEYRADEILRDEVFEKIRDNVLAESTLKPVMQGRLLQLYEDFVSGDMT